MQKRAHAATKRAVARPGTTVGELTHEGPADFDVSTASAELVVELKAAEAFAPAADGCRRFGFGGHGTNANSKPPTLWRPGNENISGNIPTALQKPKAFQKHNTSNNNPKTRLLQVATAEEQSRRSPLRLEAQRHGYPARVDGRASGEDEEAAPHAAADSVSSQDPGAT